MAKPLPILSTLSSLLRRSSPTATALLSLLISLVWSSDVEAQTWKTFHVEQASLFDSAHTPKLRWELDLRSIYRDGSITHLNTRIFSPIVDRYTVNHDVEVDCSDGIIQETGFIADGTKDEIVMFRQNDGRWFDISAVEKGFRDASLEPYYRDADLRYQELFRRVCS